MEFLNRGRKRGYFHNVVMGIDQGIGTIFGIDADETISSYVGRTHSGSKLEKIIDYIFYKISGEISHCKNSIEYEEFITN